MEPRLRIGELARRTHVSPDVLRAWERRYGLLEPQRTDGGFRLYTAADEDRVQAMVRHLGAGVSAGEAARLVLEAEAPPAGLIPSLEGVADELREALDDFDDARAQVVLDLLVTRLSFDALARDVLLPYLRELGERWERGEASVAQEHFASMVLRGRLVALARGWDRGVGPRALLACAPGERHDLGLLLFALALRQRGWRITYLGPDTPLDTLTGTVEELKPDAVVIVALTPARVALLREPLAQLVQRTRLLLAGAGVHADLADAVGAELLHGDPIEAAAELRP